MSMASVPRIFDPAVLRTRLQRAHALGFESFLLERLAEDAADRLQAVKRRFDRALDLGTPHPAFAALMRQSSQVGYLLRTGSFPQPGIDIVCSEEALPFAPQSADAVFSLMALHQVNDLPGTLRQIRQILKPDGLFLACLLGGETLTELRQSFMAAETEIAGGVSPRVAPFGDPRALGQLLQRAGFALPVADRDAITVRYADPFALMRDLRRMGLANGLAERSRTPLRRDILMGAAAHYQQHFSDGDGKIRATFDCVWLSGWAPHHSQQQPLKPGSAKMRLADALQAEEIVLRDDNKSRE